MTPPPQIAVVAVMCKPHRCPHISMTGNICVYCPGGPDSDFEYSTQSYTGYEPTSMRAIRARYNPYLQTRHRVEQVSHVSPGQLRGAAARSEDCTFRLHVAALLVLSGSFHQLFAITREKKAGNRLMCPTLGMCD